MSGLLIAAPASGAGKTTVTLALIAALARSGLTVSSAKAGPDYIDPAFHAAASGRPCVNLDPWAMRADLLKALADEARANGEAFIVEGAMGLFDGAADGTGSPADLALLLGLRTVLVVDCARQSHSVAALVSGFAGFRPSLSLAGLILNRVGSARHEMLLREALDPLGLPILACLPRKTGLALPERHLGLVQAMEHGDLGGFFGAAADWFTPHADLDALKRLARSSTGGAVRDPARLPPPGQHVAIARDAAFAFTYPHLLTGWRAAGVELSFFSPLGDEAPAADADAVYLPGGYPELHAGRLAAASNYRRGMLVARERGALIYGECGGYMALGEGLVDGAGERHAMLGFLPVATSFAERRLTLGYRRAEPVNAAALPFAVTGHEFHYATILEQASDSPLWRMADARGADLGTCGHVLGKVSGSFLHVIDRACE
ncbi:cobyrinate a,c-diamide synthase [Fulvimarina endophytica]|uniref:Hydrogenobyrinate a,c-diamide synthase n=1 Tax=Fulvimarina endophytica TaxID=2293836 RepID=A0A371X1Y5_9HYPH|nr:cobyrinate a,c-diamide synthase [Fulvimarina endophytica]RFC63054.1 cobyrinate a,c-diamide synthase [Fulvimarina endophytica]